MDDTKIEIGERYLVKWQPRMKHHEMDDEKNALREHHLGTGISLGTGFGMAIGASLGASFGNLALGLSLGIAFGTSLGVAVGLLRRDKSKQSGGRLTGTDGDCNTQPSVAADRGDGRRSR